MISTKVIKKLSLDMFDSTHWFVSEGQKVKIFRLEKLEAFNLHKHIISAKVNIENNRPVVCRYSAKGGFIAYKKNLKTNTND